MSYCDQCAKLEKELDAAKKLLKEWGVGNSAPIEITTFTTQKKQVFKGDSLYCSWSTDKRLDGVDSEPLPNGGYVNRIKAKIPSSVSCIDTVAIYSFTDALGFTNAVCGVFGEKR